MDFTKNLGNLYDKDINFLKQNKKVNLTKKIDLHGSSLREANTIVENFINDCFELGYKKLIIITGKGSRSKNFDNPYRSKKMSVLKHSVPEYIKNIYKVTVNFVSEIITCVKDKNNQVIEGNPDTIKTVHDVWKFSKNMWSQDPTWYLVDTSN